MGSDPDRGQIERFRSAFYGCLTRWPNALFELSDAALCTPGVVGSVPALSLEPEFSRSHGSLYKALAVGRVDAERLRRLLVAHRPAGPAVFAVDASVWERCDAECSPERSFYYSASKHSAGQPIVAGWSFQWICQLSFTPDSWTAPLDVERIAPRHDMVDATVTQVRRLVEQLDVETAATTDEIPMFVFDAGYDPLALGNDLADTRAQILCRVRDDPSSTPTHPSAPTGPPAPEDDLHATAPQ